MVSTVNYDNIKRGTSKSQASSKRGIPKSQASSKRNSGCRVKDLNDK